MKKKIAVYCGANSGFDEKYIAKAKELGQWMVKHDFSLVYGGGKLGLMGAVANAVLDAGGEVYGVMPGFLVNQEQAHPGLTKLEVVDTMPIRKAKMLELADFCLALPGGPGTVEEISEAFSLYRVGQSNNPVVMFNQDGYYTGIQKQYDLMVEQGFLSKSDRNSLLFTDSFVELEDFINEHLAHPRVFDFKNVMIDSQKNK